MFLIFYSLNVVLLVVALEVVIITGELNVDRIESNKEK